MAVSMSAMRDRPVVLLGSNLDQNLWTHLFRIGRERDWTLLDLRFTGNVVPRGLRPIGAFVKDLPEHPFVQHLQDTGCHVVRMGNDPHPLDDVVPAVLPDKVAAGRMAAEHFAERGFRHVGYAGQKPWGVHKALYDGLREGAEALGCDCHLLQWKSKGAATRETGYSARLKLFTEWLAGVPKPVGVLGFADWRSALYLRMCMDAQIDVPSQVGILGMGNAVNVCETVYPSLSSIAVDYEEIARKAIDVFERLYAGRGVPRTALLIPPKGILTRKSTDVLAVPDPDIAAALRFMWENYDRDIALDDVVGASGLSRRTFTDRFRTVVGSSVIEVLRAKRLYEAKNLLSMTKFSVADIAAKVGFRSIENFHRTFRAVLGTTPIRFRRGE